MPAPPGPAGPTGDSGRAGLEHRDPAPTGDPGPADDIDYRDPGLARERTDLAWTRTAISFSGLGALMLRTSPPAGAAVLAIAAAVWLLGRLSARAAGPAAGGRPGLSHRRVLQLITAATTLMSLVALALALLAPVHRY